jgi:4-carboxymuconolactone decarboxylase
VDEAVLKDHSHVKQFCDAVMTSVPVRATTYCGWPKASHIEGYIRRQWARIRKERGEAVTPWPLLDNTTLGPNDWERRLEHGAKEFLDVNLVPAPKPESPYTHAGILNFVFGHVWQRPGLSRRERRIITVASVAIDDAPTPLMSHVTSATLDSR